MIGVINQDKIFEFKEENQLITALTYFMESNGSNTLIIADSADRVAAVMYDDKFTFSNLNDDVMYTLYGTTNKYRDLGRGDDLPNDSWNFDNVKFFFRAQPIPQSIQY